MRQRINNGFYDELEEKWYTDWRHPIALLRKENEARNPWILRTIHRVLGPQQNVLDVGCGGGLLSHTLAEAGHRAVGIDLSSKSLQMAQMCDRTGAIRFVQGNAMELPFAEASFDAVCAMDLLEHVEEPIRVIREASRVLRPGGLFFFHTFNRNFFSWLIVIKGVEWCVPNTPPNLHVFHLFIKPQELKHWCLEQRIEVQEMRGLVPKLSWPFWKGMALRKVDEKTAFRFTSSLKTGYLGYGIKRSI
jgi:2-polyprenyl-6-hydroxyphenyl methylase / 3-demethylubiquinone-9 3-methyltransferase